MLVLATGRSLQQSAAADLGAPSWEEARVWTAAGGLQRSQQHVTEYKAMEQAVLAEVFDLKL